MADLKLSEPIKGGSIFDFLRNALVEIVRTVNAFRTMEVTGAAFDCTGDAAKLAVPFPPPGWEVVELPLCDEETGTTTMRKFLVQSA